VLPLKNISLHALLLSGIKRENPGNIGGASVFKTSVYFLLENYFSSTTQKEWRLFT